MPRHEAGRILLPDDAAEQVSGDPAINPQTFLGPQAPSLELVDTHCHLDLSPLAASVEAVLQRAQAAGVVHCVSIGTSVEASRANVALSHCFPVVVAAVGVHPNDADSVTDQTFAEIDALASDSRVVAIGEIGLDYYRQEARRENQHRALRALLKSASGANGRCSSIAATPTTIY